MLNKDIKLVALDMDGTLLSDDMKISEENQEAIAAALAKDVHVVLATGRSLEMTYPFSEQLNLPSYLVTVNGGQIWTVEQELLESHYMDTDLIEVMWNLADEIGLSIWMISEENIFMGDRPDDFDSEKWLKFGCNSEDINLLEELVEKLEPYKDQLEITNSLPTNLEVNPVGINKANALVKVCDKVGITMDNVLAAGDSLNDIKMIQQAGIGVAVGNAQEAVKKVADVTVETNIEHGVARAIERYVLKKKVS